MNQSEFREKALEAAPPEIPSQSVERAVKLYAGCMEKSHFYGSDIQTVYELAGELTRSKGGSAEKPIPFDVPSLTVTRDDVLHVIDGRVNQVRDYLFGSSEPPFDNYAAAVEWLDMEVASQVEPSASEQDRWRKIDRDISEKCLEAGEINSWSVTNWRTKSYFLRYHPRYSSSGEAHGLRFVRVPSHSRLVSLAILLEDLSESQGMDKFGVLRYVLTGEKPDLPAAQLEVHQYGIQRAWRAQIVLTLNTPHLTWEHFQQLHREVNDAWLEALPQRTWPLTKRDLQIKEIVAELGGEPDPPCRKEFWEKAWVRCEELEIKYKNWYGPLRAWERYKRRKLPEPPEGWTEDDMRKWMLHRRLEGRSRAATR